jgi:hypothetical protein
MRVIRLGRRLNSTRTEDDLILNLAYTRFLLSEDVCFKA